ncbi:hypothetical protein CDO36_29030 [Pseudomonas aeruginosa]|nr:hypothetical protein CDO36_29030 [Pseudomonas aeruginosa]
MEALLVLHLMLWFGRSLEDCKKLRIAERNARPSSVLELVLAQCHQPKLQPCPRQAPRSSQPPWPSGDDQASAAQSGGLAGLAVM